jgi:glycosyltransferase involved in cell wall biosynthesis
MLSHLSPYPGSCSNQPKKFLRSANSFKKQTYTDSELIIISDGCQITNDLYQQHYSTDPNISLIKLPKQPPYPASRNEGIKAAKGEIISYLDADDYIAPNHLSIIAEQFTDDVDWVYYNDYLVQSADFKTLYIREVEPRHGSIGTSSISHRNFNSERYKDMENKPKWTTGYSHDFYFVMDMVGKGLQFKKLKRCPAYLVAHYNGGDF